MPRRQLPVHSPVSVGAISAGLSAALRGEGEGALRERVERLLRERYDATSVALTDSGTSALRLAIAGAAKETGAPVAIPGYCCYDMATATEGAGARALLYDVDADTLGPSRESVAEAEAAGVRSVVVAHLFGHLVDVPAVRGALRDGTLLIEDAAQGSGGRIGGKRLGSFGSVSVLSFGRGKGMTGGGGGALLAHDPVGDRIVDEARGELLPGGRGLASLVKLAGQLVLGRPSLYALPASLPFLHLGETRYHEPWVPVGASVSALAVLERVVPLSDRARKAMSANAARLARAVAECERLSAPAGIPDASPGFLRLPVVISGLDRESLVDDHAKRLGVERGYPTTLEALPSLRPHLVGGGGPLTGSGRLGTSLITLPTHELLTEADLTALEAWIRRVG